MSTNAEVVLYADESSSQDDFHWFFGIGCISRHGTLAMMPAPQRANPDACGPHITQTIYIVVKYAK